MGKNWNLIVTKKCESCPKLGKQLTKDKVYMTATKEEHREEKLTVASSTLSRQTGCSDLEISLEMNCHPSGMQGVNPSPHP